ncbi:MAG: transposase [Bryobacteraceae bacterium]|jgi:REP element-mobilizing transposase RayT
MLFYRRRLPHWFPDRSIIFVTWRLAGSTPFTPEILTAENTGRIPFHVRDQWLDRSNSGPFWLRDERIARVVQDALHYGANVRRAYDLCAWAIMPNHVHAVWEPHIPMPAIMRWLKGRTSRIANRVLGRSGQAFWQDESYDHWIRSASELDEVIKCVESNPVKAGLVSTAEQWLWSSARL